MGYSHPIGFIHYNRLGSTERDIATGGIHFIADFHLDYGGICRALTRKPSPIDELAWSLVGLYRADESERRLAYPLLRFASRNEAWRHPSGLPSRSAPWLALTRRAQWSVAIRDPIPRQHAVME